MNERTLQKGSILIPFAYTSKVYNNFMTGVIRKQVINNFFTLAEFGIWM